MNSELLFCYLHVVTVLILLLKIEINLINYDVSKVNLKLVNQKRYFDQHCCGSFENFLYSPYKPPWI